MKSKILNSLDGKALKIARALFGDYKKLPKHIQEAVDGLIQWADNLGKKK